MPIIANIVISAVISSAVFIGGVNLSSDTLSQLSLKAKQLFGAFTTISTATNLATFPATYNANLTKTIEVGTTSLPTITTLAGLTTASALATVGTLTSGALSTGFTVVPVALGGTGTTSPTSNLVMLGNGSSGLKTVNGFGTSGQFLQSNGDATAPSWTTSAIDETGSYNWTGTNFLVKNLSASSTAANPIKLNTVSYSFPSSQGAASTTPRNDGTGAIDWFRPDVMVVASTTLTSAVATTTLAIPSNAGTDIRILVRIPSTSANSDIQMQLGGDTGANYSWGVQYGATFASESTKSVISLTGGAEEVTQGRYFDIMITNEGGVLKTVKWTGGRVVGAAYNGIGSWSNTAGKVTSVTIGAGEGSATMPANTRITVIGYQAAQI